MSDKSLKQKERDQHVEKLIHLFIAIGTGDWMLVDKNGNEVDWLNDCLTHEKDATNEMFQKIVNIMHGLVMRNNDLKLIKVDDLSKNLYKK